jgi:predicted secreted hydrolase
VRLGTLTNQLLRQVKGGEARRATPASLLRTRAGTDHRKQMNSRVVLELGVLARLLTCMLIATLSAPAAAALHEPGTPVVPDAPDPVTFPRDDGPHDTNVEWWYFTGHLLTEEGDRYGFEYVIFRARDGNLEGYAAHFAIADNPSRQFHYDQRLRGAAGVAGDADVLDLDLSGWTMRGGDGQFALAADMPGYVMRLDVATTKPAALHDGDGYIDYGYGTASYYYSWTRMKVAGELDLGQGATQASGEAWMDHQWGDFATYQAGGWDWFSAQLDDGTDVMLYLIRDADGQPLRVDGSIVGPDGEYSALREGDFAISVDGKWTSPGTGTTYPSGWTITIPDHELSMTVSPSLPDQELDTRATTGVIYWEGEAVVAATHGGRRVAGFGYTELTGYAPYEPLDLERSVGIATPVP